MSYCIKRILTVFDGGNRELYQKIANAVEDITDFNFKVYDDHIDDSNWNFGSGISGIWDDSTWTRVSELFPDVEFTVHCVHETCEPGTEPIVEYHCYGGHCDEFVLHQTKEWYEANKDGYEKNPGVRPGYFTDYGIGENYPIKYGDSYIPAGVDWTQLPENEVKKSFQNI